MATIEPKTIELQIEIEEGLAQTFLDFLETHPGYDMNRAGEQAIALFLMQSSYGYRSVNQSYLRAVFPKNVTGI